jgi:hypothetical protein
MMTLSVTNHSGDGYVEFSFADKYGDPQVVKLVPGGSAVIEALTFAKIEAYVPVPNEAAEAPPVQEFEPAPADPIPKPDEPPPPVEPPPEEPPA